MKSAVILNQKRITTITPSHSKYAGSVENTTQNSAELIDRPCYDPTDLLNFEQVVAWFDVAPRTVERMHLAWSRPSRGRLRRILFRDLLLHVERRKD